VKAIGEASAKKAKIVNIDARKLGKPVFCSSAKDSTPRFRRRHRN
jgi:hypothetical protein